MRASQALLILLGALLWGNAFADWQVQVQEKNGSWRNSYSRKTEVAARQMAEIECSTGGAPLRIVDTIAGTEYQLFCDPSAGKLTTDGKPSPVILLGGSELSKRAADVKAACQGNAFLNATLDCKCIEEKAKLELAKSDANVTSDSVLQKLIRPASQECVDRQGTFDWAYAPCVDIMKNTRPKDFESFCQCTANTTASNFASRPLLNTVHYRRLNQAAMKQCEGRKTSG
jgi:hypothetical protein